MSRVTVFVLGQQSPDPRYGWAENRGWEHRWLRLSWQGRAAQNQGGYSTGQLGSPGLVVLLQEPQAQAILMGSAGKSFASDILTAPCPSSVCSWRRLILMSAQSGFSILHNQRPRAIFAMMIFDDY